MISKDVGNNKCNKRDLELYYKLSGETFIFKIKSTENIVKRVEIISK